MDNEIYKLILKSFLTALSKEKWLGALTIIDAYEKIRQGTPDSFVKMHPDLFKFEQSKVEHSKD